MWYIFKKIRLLDYAGKYTYIHIYIQTYIKLSFKIRYMGTKRARGQVRIMTEKIDLTRVITTGLFMLREMGDLTLAAAVDHSLAATTLLELHL